MATVSCKCGAVNIKFATALPRCTSECCCDDCYKRLTFLAKQGGPALEHGHYMRTKPIMAHFFDNRMEVISGLEKLRFFKLRPESGVVNMASSCCNTFLAKENVRYEGNVVAVFDLDFGAPTMVDDEHQPVPEHHRHNLKHFMHQEPMIRMFPTDWLDEHVQFLHPLPSIWLNEIGEVTGSPRGWEEVFERFMDITTEPVPENLIGDKFGHILAVSEKEVDIASTAIFTDMGAINDTTKAAIGTVQ